jgi:thiamine-monophosphate kinase
VVGPGDDCAVLRPSAGRLLVATTDALVEGVHFDLSLSSARDAGHKALAVNLSDLAAAGARPRWFLCALGVPRAPDLRGAAVFATARSLGEGMAALARESGVALVGGNVAGAERWSLTLTALGEASAPLSRRGARPGDALVLAGQVGAAALGLRLLRGSKRRGPDLLARALRAVPASTRAALRAQLRPDALVSAGLAAAPIASASIDLSDGLLADLGHLLHASRCGAELDLERLPRSAAVRAAEAALADAGEHSYALSLSGGEDYSLLFAVRPARERALLAALRRSGTSARTVGRCVRGRSIALRERGRPVPLPRQAGWDHLSRA